MQSEEHEFECLMEEWENEKHCLSIREPPALTMSDYNSAKRWKAIAHARSFTPRPMGETDVMVLTFVDDLQSQRDATTAEWRERPNKNLLGRVVLVSMRSLDVLSVVDILVGFKKPDPEEPRNWFFRCVMRTTNFLSANVYSMAVAETSSIVTGLMTRINALFSVCHFSVHMTPLELQRWDEIDGETMVNAGAWNEVGTRVSREFSLPQTPPQDIDMPTSVLEAFFVNYYTRGEMTYGENFEQKMRGPLPRKEFNVFHRVFAARRSQLGIGETLTDNTLPYILLEALLALAKTTTSVIRMMEPSSPNMRAAENAMHLAAERAFPRITGKITASRKWTEPTYPFLRRGYGAPPMGWTLMTRHATKKLSGQLDGKKISIKNASAFQALNYKGRVKISESKDVTMMTGQLANFTGSIKPIGAVSNNDPLIVVPRFLFMWMRTFLTGVIRHVTVEQRALSSVASSITEQQAKTADEFFASATLVMFILPKVVIHVPTGSNLDLRAMKYMANAIGDYLRPSARSVSTMAGFLLMEMSESYRGPNIAWR